MHELLAKELAPDEIAVCPHDDGDGCQCRKPAPGMLTDLAAKWGVALNQSVMVGDSWRDLEAGRRAGCQTVLVASASVADGPKPDAQFASVSEAVEWIIGHEHLGGFA